MPRPVAGARRRRRGLPYPDLRPRRHPAGPILVAAVATFLALGAARPAAGQAAQDTTRAAAGQDTTKTRAELIRERIRTLGPLIRSPDSLAADSARADSLARVAEGQIPRNTPPSLTGAARDSMIDALLGLDGYTVTEYRAKRARFEADSSRLDLREEAEVVTEGQKLVADSSIIFSQETAIACAYGKPTLSGGGTGAPVVADSLCFNVDTKRGIAHGARSEVTEGATWIVFSDESFTVGDTVYSHGGTFTDCNLEEPHYHFGAGELKVIRGDILVGRNVTFNFKDVPVFWLPFFAQSMKRGRRSGVLFPRFGVNDIARNRPTYRRRIEDVGFYWAINDYMGAEVALDWQADNFTSLRGSYDFRSLEHFLAGGLTYRKYWRAEGGTEFAVAGQTDWQMNERTRLNGTVSYTSSTRFVQQNSLDPRELNQSIDSRMGLNRKFDFGSLNLSGSRQQFLSDNTVNTTLPTVAFTLNSITLFGALPGDEKWYSNATWTGSLNSNVRSKGIAADNPAPTLQGNREVTANVTSRFQMGKFSWNQDFRYTDHQDRERTVAITPDSMIDLASRFQTRMTWSTGLDFQQRLIGTTTFTPGIQASGEFLEADTTGGQRVAAPTRININASLRTDLFRIFPGFGPVQAIRHKISPGVAWQYSPRPTITDRQREVFNINDIREQNRLRISLSQTFEAKMKQQPGVGPGGQGGAGAVPGDSTGLAADSLAQSIAGTAADTSTGPRRRQTVQPITLLSITTDAMVYDFVRAREDNEGFQTMELGQTIQSDLIRGLQLSFAHNLFRQVTDSAGDTKREFAPKLSRVTASFSLNSDSWLARAIGLGSQRGAEGGTQQGGAGTQIDSTEAPPQVPQTDAEFGLLGSSRGTRPQTQQRIGRAGTWNASFNYSLTQPR
ncbi:MAG: putative LPS assembly protein LptD, partial [Gemmatimonadota bacterium]